MYLPQNCDADIQHSWKLDNRAQEKYREQIYFVEVSIATSENFSNTEQFLAQCYRCHLCFNDELLAGGYFERFRDLRSGELRGVSDTFFATKNLPNFDSSEDTSIIPRFCNFSSFFFKVFALFCPDFVNCQTVRYLHKMPNR